MERRGKRRKQLLDHLKWRRGYWKLKEEVLIVLQKTGFGRGYGPVVRQVVDLMNDNSHYTDW